MPAAVLLRESAPNPPARPQAPVAVTVHFMLQLLDSEDFSVASRWTPRLTTAFILITCSTFWALAAIALSFVG